MMPNLSCPMENLWLVLQVIGVFGCTLKSVGDTSPLEWRTSLSSGNMAQPSIQIIYPMYAHTKYPTFQGQAHPTWSPQLFGLKMLAQPFRYIKVTPLTIMSNGSVGSAVLAAVQQLWSWVQFLLMTLNCFGYNFLYRNRLLWGLQCVRQLKWEHSPSCQMAQLVQLY